MDSISFYSTSDVVHDGVQQTSKPMGIVNERFSYNSHGAGYSRPVVCELFRFSTVGAGVITAITDDVTAVSGNAL